MTTSPLVLMKLRQRAGLAMTDATMDAELDALPPIEKLRMVCGWTLGDPSWADYFIDWASGCGIEIKDPRD